MSDPDDLDRDDWRLGPEDDGLRQFARRLEAALPALPAESLARVRRSMQAEIVRLDRRRRTWLALGSGSLAAAILVGLGLWAATFRGGAAPQDEPIAKTPPSAPTVVEGRYQIALTAMPAQGMPSGPLVPLSEYRSLIEGAH